MPLSDRGMVLYYLDLDTREILTSATENPQTGVRLTPREQDMIAILIGSGGVKMSARVLGEEIWPIGKTKNSATFARVYASRLKKRLGQVSSELADNLLLLETSGWKGYIWKWEGNPYTPDISYHNSLR